MTKQNRNGLIIGIVGIVVLVAGIWFAGSKLFGGMATNANYVFEQFAAGNEEAAYNSTASDFQNSTSLQYFIQLGKAWGMDTVVDTTWNSRGFTGDLGYLQGSITHEDGTKTAAYVNLIKERGEWRVVSVYFGDAAYNPGAYSESSEAPEGEE